MADQSKVRGVFASLFQGLRNELKSKASEHTPTTARGLVTKLGMNLLGDAAGEMATIVSKLLCSICGKTAHKRLLRYTSEKGEKGYFYFCDDCATKCPDPDSVEPIPQP